MGLFNRERFKVKEDLVYVKVGESGFETYEKSYYPQFSIKIGPWKYKNINGFALRKRMVLK